MKQLLTAAFAAVLLLPFAASAQQAPPPPDREMGGWMSSLTDAQRQQIMPVLQQSRQQADALMQSALSRELAALSSDHRAQVQSILNAAAQATPPPPPPADNGTPGSTGRRHFGMMRQFAQQIDAILTPSEASAVMNINKDVRAQMQTLQDNAENQIRQYLTDAQKTEVDQMKANRQQFASGRQARPDDAGMDIVMAARPPRHGEPRR